MISVPLRFADLHAPCQLVHVYPSYVNSCMSTHPMHARTHPPTHLLSQLPSYTLSHAPTNLPFFAPTHSPTHSLAFVLQPSATRL